VTEHGLEAVGFRPVQCPSNPSVRVCIHAWVSGVILCQQTDTHLACYNCDVHQLISICFGRIVTEGVRYQIVTSGWQEGHPACKTLEWLAAGMVICLERGADLHNMAQLMPVPLTVSCFSKIQVGFTCLILAHLGSP